MVGKTTHAKHPAPGHPVLQWAMAGAGLAGSLVVIGVTLVEAMHAETPASLTAIVLDVRPTTYGHIAEVRVSNSGDAAASAVHVQAVAGEPPAQAVADYVPGGGEATVYLAIQGPTVPKVKITGWSAP